MNGRGDLGIRLPKKLTQIFEIDESADVELKIEDNSTLTIKVTKAKVRELVAVIDNKKDIQSKRYESLASIEARELFNSANIEDEIISSSRNVKDTISPDTPEEIEAYHKGLGLIITSES